MEVFFYWWLDHQLSLSKITKQWEHFQFSNAQTKASPFLESSEQHVFSWRDAWCAHMCLGLKYLLSDGHVSRESLHFGHLLFVCSQFSGSFKRSVTWSLLDICGMEDFVHSYLIANYWKSPATFKSFLFFFFTKLTTFGCLALWCQSLPSLTIRAVSSLLCYLCNLILNSFFFFFNSK